MDESLSTAVCSGQKTFYPKPASGGICSSWNDRGSLSEQLNKYLCRCRMPGREAAILNMVHGVNAEEVKQDLKAYRRCAYAGQKYGFYRCKEAGFAGW